jgi:DNA-binding ferritin-like protein
MERYVKIASLYLATLKAIYLIHQHGHWTTNGGNFYGNHLLFQRLYEAAQESADLAAEKFLGVFGEEVIDLKFQNDLLGKLLSKFTIVSSDPTQRSIAAEKQFLKLSQDAYDAFKDDDVMTLGMDDMIMSIASKSEEAVYLLQQSLKK